MKKIFKYGCGCLGIIFGLIVLLIIFAHCDSSSDSPKQQSVNQNNDFIELFDGVDSEIDSQLKWNKKGSRKFLQESAIEHVENFLEQNKLRQGFDPKTKQLCLVEHILFSERECRNINLFRSQIELKGFMLWLYRLSELVHCDMSEINNVLQVSTSMKWGDFDFHGIKTITKQKDSDSDTAIDFSMNLILSKNGQDFIKYIQDEKGENLKSSNLMIKGCAYDELIRNHLKYNPGAVKLEYSAWSWDEKDKCGEFARLMVLDFNKIQKAK